MTTPKSLPARPSLESLRKQAKKLAREIAAGSADAIARVRAQLPTAGLPLSHRDAQLVLAREYGYPGWKDLTAEVLKRSGRGLEWAADHAQQLIHDNNLEGLKQLVAEYPALLSWRGDPGGLLASAVISYGDSGDPLRERHFTRRECAQWLIDAGAVVDPSVCEGLIQSRTRGLLELFQSKGLLPRTLRFRVALGDLDGVRACFDERGGLVPAPAGPDGDSSRDYETDAVNEAFRVACYFEHEEIATFLLDRCISLDGELGRQVDAWQGRVAFIKYLMEDRPLTFTDVTPKGPWQTFLMYRVMRAIHEDDLTTFSDVLQRESWLLGEPYVGLQVGLIERATLRDRGAFIEKLLELAPALVRRHPPPHSQAIEFALTYAKPHLLPIVTRIWPLPDDLPHAAGTGDFDRVKRWCDGPPHSQLVLDTALAWSVLNRHFEIAGFLLEHGADINTRWSSHEPASILHELVFHDNYEGMQFLIDHGIDMTIIDYRWGGTAEGWARYAANNEKMGDWLAAAEKRRQEQRR